MPTPENAVNLKLNNPARSACIDRDASCRFQEVVCIPHPDNDRKIQKMQNANQTRIEELFPDDQTVASIRIADYLDWAAHSNTERYSRVLAMPPIQRGFVWKPKQIQDLWDSLSRGMPISSVLLKESQPDEKSTGLTPVDRHVEANAKPGFHLLDGQQRTLAMLLGFPSSLNALHKLWIDFNEPGKNGSLFQFRVTTETQPFGFNPDGSRLSLAERRKARACWMNEDEVKVNKTNWEIFNDEATRPWKAGGKGQEYIFEVKNLWQWMESKGGAISMWQVIGKCQEQNSELKFYAETTSRIKEFCTALNELQNQWLALIKIPRIKEQTDINNENPDYLTMLFNRISSNGTRLSPEDLLFSMIKQSWPEAHNIVYQLQQRVGSLMQPTDFVMTAFRLASLQSHASKVNDPELNARTFHRRIAEMLASDGHPYNLREMIRESGALISTFDQLKTLIKYRGIDEQGVEDYGIPDAMFPYLDKSVLQSVLFWLIKNQENQTDIEESRLEIVRFILFWFVCHKDAHSAYKASKIAIEIISREKGLFPGTAIYQALTRTDSDQPALFIPLAELTGSKYHSNQFHTPDERAKIHFSDNTILYSHFTSRIKLLLWLQRKWIAHMYQSANAFNPMAGQDEDNVPYDFDHLVPQSNWSSLHGIEYSALIENNNLFSSHPYNRRTLGNSIGNYRVLDSSDNRSRGDCPLDGDFLEENELWEKYAFHPDENEIQMWRKASPVNDCHIWSDERLIAFQSAVESRVIDLYQRFFNELDFSAWTKL